MRFLVRLLGGRLISAACTILLSGLCAVAIFSQQAASTDSSPAAPAAAETKTVAGMTVSFESPDGVLIVESNGQKIRIDPVRRTVEAVSSDRPLAAPAAAQETVAKKAQSGEGAYDFDKGEEPYANRLINVPTPRSVPKGTWNLEFTHRFSQPIHPLDESAPALFGLDSFGIASFGISYGVTNKLYLSAYRSPLCQRGLCRTIELGVGYNFLTQDAEHPIALSANASIEGNDNFTEEYTYNLQARLSARAGKRVYFFFSPAVHLNANGQHRFNPRPTDFFPPAPIASTLDLGTHTASFGFGAAVLIRPDLLATFEFTPRTGFKLGRVTPVFSPTFQVIGFNVDSQPEIGFGIQKNIGKHSFALTFSNTQTTTTSRYNSSNLVFSPRRLIIGFNLTRRF